MSRQQVRLALRDWLGQAAIPDLNQIFTSFPKRINFQVNAPAGALNRAACVIFIASETESRIGLGGAYDGWKRIDYLVQLQLFHHSGCTLAEDAMTSFDTIVDSVKEQLRAGGHTLDQDSDVIWQAAEDEITVNYGEPVTNSGGMVETWASIDFTVTQMFRA